MSVFPGLTVALRSQAKADALTERMIGEIGAFADYGERNGVNMYIGELGWPNDKADTPAWNKAIRRTLEYCRERNLPVVLWDSGMMRASYRLGIWQPASNFNQVSVKSATALIAEEHLRKQTSVYGGVFLNTAAQNAVWGTPSNTSGSGGTTHYQYFSNVNTGVAYNGSNSGSATYAYDNLATFQYLYRVGVRTVMLGFRWERLQPTLSSAFNADEQTRLTTAVSNAISAGLRVMIQPFNKGAYYVDNGGSPSHGVRHRIGVAGDGSTVTDATFYDLWERLSGLFKDEAGVVAYGIMNEPATGTMSGWQTTTQGVVDTLRGLSDNKHIIVPMLTWRHLADFGGAHPTPWIDDSADNVSYEGHIYFDANGGAYSETYASLLAEARSGYRVYDSAVGADANPTSGYGQVGAEFPRLVSNMERASNLYKPVASSGEMNRKVGSPDGIWQVMVNTWDTVTSSRETFLQFRMSWDANNNLWRFGISGSTWYLQKRVAGSWSTVYSSVTTSTVAQASNQLVEVESRGAAIRCRVGGVEVYQTTDTHLQGAAMCGYACSNAPNVRFGWSGFKPIY